MEKLDGMINDIVFRNEENGFTIAQLSNSSEDICIVGCMPTIQIGESIEVEGKWTNHQKFGLQFQVSSFMPVTPSSVEGIYVYLSSGMINGVGEKMAKKIIDKFGVDTLNVIQNEPEKLTEIEGIGKKKIEQIIKSYEEDRELRNIIITLSPYGITPAYCLKIYKKYKENAISIINENPYRLADEIYGIGFKIADKIAGKLGIAKDSDKRISQGIIYTLSNATTNGHTFLPRNELILNSINLLGVDKILVEQNVDSLMFNKKIYIERFNNEENVYLISYYICESSVSENIITLCNYGFENLNIDIDDEIKVVEKSENIVLAKNQVLAVKEAINSGVVIITGGPGTGKTTTINTIIKIFENNKKKVMLCAPTGRAAKRMSETSGREAKTIHRLLEMEKGAEGSGFTFFKDEDSPLECDVIIIDEVSMVDIHLMFSLLKAISVGTRVIFVGDSDQLPSVGAGNVLADLIESKVVKTVKLIEIFRQASESMIVINAHQINKGQPLYLNKRDKDFFFIKTESEKDTIDEIVNLVQNRLPTYYGVDKIKDIQILSTMRKGDVGVTNLNMEVQKVVNKKESYKIEESFQNRILRVGDKVMQIKNNYQKKWESGSEKGEGVFNGDIGFIEYIDKDKKTILVAFDDKSVKYKYEELDELDHSFCTTIHKSQGSEFPVVIMPICWAPPMLLSRNILYTGVTRAKKLVVLVGEAKYLDYMVQNNRTNKRYSNLSNKLISMVSK
ncbi:MAG: ATP-dependent RecD-like DNA helicase [Peptostreptococcaceae bacterium]